MGMEHEEQRLGPVKLLLLVERDGEVGPHRVPPPDEQTTQAHTQATNRIDSQHTREPHTTNDGRSTGPMHAPRASECHDRSAFAVERYFVNEGRPHEQL